MATAGDVGVGIDVAKAQVDIAVEPTGATWTVPRSRGGLRRLQEQRQALRPIRIVVEASGGYERLVVATLAAAGLPVVRVNPRQTHDFARALGILAKTDRIDARTLARFAAEVRSALRSQPSTAEHWLQTLVRRWHQLVRTRVTEQLQRPHLEPEELAGSDALLAMVRDLIRQADRDLAALVLAARRHASTPPQLPAPTLTTSRTHFTNESIVVATSQRSPTPRPRTCPPAPRGHPHACQHSPHGNQRRRRRQQLHCLHCHHPPSRSPVRPSSPASPTTPAARAITRTPCARSRDAASQPHPSSQATPITSRTHSTNESLVVATSQRAPTPRPRTWPPAPHGLQFPPAWPAPTPARALTA